MSSPLSLPVVLEELAPLILAGGNTSEDGVENPRHSIDLMKEGEKYIRSLSHRREMDYLINGRLEVGPSNVLRLLERILVVDPTYEKGRTDVRSTKRKVLNIGKWIFPP